MQLVSGKLKLLIAVILGLMWIVPGLSQQNFRNRNDTEISTTKQRFKNRLLPTSTLKSLPLNKEPTTKVPTGNPFLPTKAPPKSKNPFLPTKRTTKRPHKSNKKRSRNGTTSTPPLKTKSEVAPRSDTCRGPDLLYGVCTPLAECQPLVTRLQENPSNQTLVNFLRTSNQICGNEYAMVCCPSPNQKQFQQLRDKNLTKLPTREDGCGSLPPINPNLIHTQVVGGKKSSIGRWPWIALIGYDVKVSGSPFKCGGTLITKRHILTAAHCIRSDLTFVRLGEHNLNTDDETKHIDVPVAKSLRHPGYNHLDGRNDIALLYLAKDVRFTEKIRPICLPISPQLRAETYLGRTPYVAGWGRTLEGGETATVLQELLIPNVFNNSYCKDLYKKQKKLVSQQQFDDVVICAGDLDGGKDTCQGDSGGPLMTLEPVRSIDQRYYLIGIVSYSIGCARKEIPGVYSRVTSFIAWIEKGIADTS